MRVNKGRGFFLFFPRPILISKAIMSDKPNFQRMLKAELAEVADELWARVQSLTEKVDDLNEERVQVLNELADLQDAQPDKPNMKLVETINLDPVAELVNYLGKGVKQARDQRGMMQADPAQREFEAKYDAAKAFLDELFAAAEPETEE